MDGAAGGNGRNGDLIPAELELDVGPPARAELILGDDGGALEGREELAALCGGLAQNPYGQYLRGVLEGRRDAPGEVRA